MRSGPRNDRHWSEPTLVKRAEAYLTAENLRETTAAWLRRLSESFRPRPWLRIDPPRCALIVTDMQRHFASPEGRAWLPSTAAILPGIARLLDAWRRMGAPVVFTLHGHGESEDPGMLGRFFTDLLLCGEEDARLVPQLVPLPGERVLRKSTYDAFHGTDLEEHLRARGAAQVLVTGVMTQLCCETTARSAFVRGFEVHVAADATATRTEALHLGSLAGLASGVASVTDVDSILRCVDG